MNTPAVDYHVNVWSCLESSRGLTAIAASWRERLDEEFDSFKTTFLQRAHGVPKGMPCPRGCACAHEIVSDECRVSSDEGKQNDASSPSPLGEGTGKGDRDIRKSRTHDATELSTINSPPSIFRAICRCDPPNCPDIPLTAGDIV